MELAQIVKSTLDIFLCIRLHKDIVVCINWKEHYLEGKL